MTFGELIKEAMDWVYAFWPVRVVHDWEQGVRCVFGNVRGRLTSTNGLFGTGLHIFWPIVSEILVDETNLEVVETDIQTVITDDDETVTFSLGIKFRINNLARMYTSIHDARETIYTEVCSVAGWCVSRMEYVMVAEDLCEHILRETKEQMGEWGIELISLSLINLNTAQPLRLITNRGQGIAELPEVA